MRTRTFKVFDPDELRDKPWICDAIDHEHAAEKYAEYSDNQGDYGIVRGDTIRVTVESEDGIQKVFILSGYQTSVYSTREIDLNDR